MITRNSFWEPAIAICRSTRSEDLVLADANREEIAEKFRLRREALMAESTAPWVVPFPIPGGRSDLPAPDVSMRVSATLAHAQSERRAD